MRAKVNGGELFFDVHGDGLRLDEGRLVDKPVVLALHGGPGTVDHYQLVPILDALTDLAQVVYVDHRGNGRSWRPPVETCSLEAMADDLESLREQLGLTQLTVFGMSVGGMLALTYATRYPRHVARLIPCAAPASHEFVDEARAIARERATAEQLAAAEKFLAGAFADEADMRASFALLSPLYCYRADLLTGPPPPRAAINVELLNWFFATGVKQYDVRPRLEDIRVPTLVLTARHDWICPPSQAAVLMERIPNARQVMFERSGHRLMQEEPEKLIRALRDFMTMGDVASA